MGERPEGVPDLLFEAVRGARVEQLSEVVWAPGRLGAGGPLHRVTLFLTYGCNLRCPYCKTIARDAAALAQAPQKKVTYTPARVAALLDGLSDMAIAHLHLTGGEASLVPGVVEMVAAAKARGIRHVSMTSNGTAPTERYVALVEAGLDELRLSLDARDEAQGATLSGRPGAWARTVEAFRAVAAVRDAGAPVRLVANVVVGTQNRATLVPLVRFLLSLSPDDVKLITEVDARDELPDFPERAEVLAGLAQVLAEQPPEALPLLRRKLATVFARDAIGLPAGLPASWRCWVPLTERTVDGVGLYPCSVYLREGGAPLARVEEPASAQREKTRAWVETHACGEDPVCRRYCLHCTRAYNDEMNAARKRAVRAWLEAPPRLTPGRPFLLLTPLGLEDASVAPFLQEGGVRPRAVHRVDDYPRRSLALYARTVSDARLELGLAYEAAWRRRCTSPHAEVWELDAQTFSRAWQLKASWRARWPAEGVGALLLQRLHLPDPGEVDRQWAWLRA
jgi:molybdenum cofactor biosynthesis enzyme MoaA